MFYWPTNLPAFRTVETYQVTTSNHSTVSYYSHWRKGICSSVYNILHAVLWFCCFSFSFQTASFRCTATFSTCSSQGNCRTWNLYFCKNILYGNCKQYILVLCVLTRASVAPPLSQCFLLQETNSSKALWDTLCVTKSVCHHFFFWSRGAIFMLSIF